VQYFFLFWLWNSKSCSDERYICFVPYPQTGETQVFNLYTAPSKEQGVYRTRREVRQFVHHFSGFLFLFFFFTSTTSWQTHTAFSSPTSNHPHCLEPFLTVSFSFMLAILNAARGGLGYSRDGDLLYEAGEGPVLFGGAGESLRGGILSLTLSRPLASAKPLIL